MIVGKKIAEGTFLWEPSKERKETSNLMHYMNWLKENRNLHFHSYDELWKWSTSELEFFWESLYEYFEIKSTPYLRVLNNRKMPEVTWFEGAKLNYSEHIFCRNLGEKFAIIAHSETRPKQVVTWNELESKVSQFAQSLKNIGVKRGDRVVAYIPNIPEAVIAFLACASIGAVWSSCSPDFGSLTVIDRFKQIEPKIFIAVDGYRYGGKDFHRLSTVQKIQEALPSLETTILLPYLSDPIDLKNLKNTIFWDEFVRGSETKPLAFERVPFNHPLWILFSSGTTGLPKAIVHGHGGIVLEHLKQLILHLDLKGEDRFFWFTTTGWMMWNMVVSGLLAGSTILLFDGNPGYPNLNTLWKFAEETEMTVFGTSATFLLSCRNANIRPKKYNLEKLKTIGSTGSPLPPEGFAWVYEHVKEDIWLTSISGGTDLCTAFVGGSPLHPVLAGEIQCRSLGAKVEAFNEKGEGVVDDVGELVITEPMPSMPIFFWNDPTGEKYYHSYFHMYPNIWRHGDWIKITSQGSCQIYGRSDSTINRGGVRMGTSEIYRAVEGVRGVKDSLVIDLGNDEGKGIMVLFVELEKHLELHDSIVNIIKQSIRENCSPRHVPDYIYKIEEVPRTLNGKKLEVPIKKILMGIPLEKAANKGSLSNPKSLDYFLHLRKQPPFNQLNHSSMI